MDLSSQVYALSIQPDIYYPQERYSRKSISFREDKGLGKAFILDYSLKYKLERLSENSNKTSSRYKQSLLIKQDPDESITYTSLSRSALVQRSHKFNIRDNFEFVDTSFNVRKVSRN